MTHTTTPSRTLCAAAAAIALLLPVAGHAAEEELWLHVRVEETDGARVKVNLPLAMIEKGMPMLEEHHHLGRHGIAIEDADLDVRELRELWAELQASPDMTFVTVEEDDESVRVSKSGGYMLVDVDERHGAGEHVQARIPLAVVAALLSGDGDELDLGAAMAALAAHGEGELVTVRGDRETVRVWVDAIAEAD